MGQDGAATQSEEIEVMVTVKAAPEPSVSYGETVCVAGLKLGIMTPPKWVRLFPVPFRKLEDLRQFRKDEVIRLEVERHPRHRDYRPESFRPVNDSIVSLGYRRDWSARRRDVDLLPRPTMCSVNAEQGPGRTSLAMVRAREVLDFVWEDESEGSKHRTKSNLTRRIDLFDQKSEPLEVCPYRFKYHYLCDEPQCPSHSQSIIDWELSEAWRRWRTRYGPDEVFPKLRDKFLDEMCGPGRDTHFFVGNQHKAPEAFLVLGVWWPPR